MEGDSISYATLLIIATSAFLIPIVVNRIKWIRIPVVVGELFIGILIGKNGFNIIKFEPWLMFLSTLGITYLMFLSGVEIDFKLLRKLSGEKTGRRLFVLTSLYFVLVLVASIGVGMLFTRLGMFNQPWLVALILTTVSVGVVLPTIKEQFLISTEYGQTILVIALIMDFVTILLLAVFVALMSGGDPARLALVALLFLVVFALYVGGDRLRQRPIMVDLAHATSQIGVRGSFMLIFVLAFLSQRLGVEIILGAFLAGAIVSLIAEEDKTSLHLKLEAIGFGFLIPIFFIMVGAQFDIQALINNPSSLILAAAIIAVAYVVKVLPSLIFSGRYGLKKALGIGVLVTPGLSLTVAAAEIGFRMDLLTSSTHAAMICLAIVTAAISPVLFERLSPVGEVSHKERVIIVGADEKGLLLATRLADYGNSLLVIDKENDRVKEAINRGFHAEQANVTDVGAWEKIAPDEQTQVVITTKAEQTNRSIVEILTSSFNVGGIVAYAIDPDAAALIEQMGARPVTPALTMLSVMENLVRHPDMFELLNQEDDKVSIRKVTLAHPVPKRLRVKDLQLPNGTLILAIGRGREHVIPRGDTLLQMGDVLTLAGPPDDLSPTIVRLRRGQLFA